MDKKNKQFLIILIILTIVVIALGVYGILTNKNTSANKFRNDYMELNDKNSEGTDYTYPQVVLSDKNLIKYINEEEAVDIIKNKSGVIYFGFPACLKCRSIVSTLVKVSNDLKEPIYYLDVANIMSSFELIDGKLNKIKDGSEGYYKILDSLSSILENFYLEDENGNKYETEEKRLNTPSVIAIKDGQITDYHFGSVATHTNPYNKLSTEEEKELENIYINLINSKN